MKEVKIDKNNKNQRVDKFLLKYLNKATKSFIYKMIRKKNIKLNGKKITGNEILKINDVLTLYLSEETINKFKEYKTSYSFYNSLNIKNIIYEDENIIAINKPKGVIVHSATNDKNENTLIDSSIKYLIDKGEFKPENSNGFKPAVCNRLDVNTSGIVVIGKNLSAVQHLNKMFKEKTIDKIYETIVVGDINKNGEIKGFHNKDEKNNIVNIATVDEKNSKYVCTKYYKLKSNGDYTHLKIKLITGKAHQIRASLKHINHSIIGDRKYGDSKENVFFKKKYSLNNQLLHAISLTFNDDKGCLAYLCNKKLVAPKDKTFLKIENDLFNSKS